MKAKTLSKQVFTGTFKIVEQSRQPFTLVVEGDSVGAGVGASSFPQTLAGKLANQFAVNYSVTVKNNSISGLKTKDLASKEPEKGMADFLLLVIGSNDLFHLTKVTDFETSVKEMLEKFSFSAKKVVLIGPGRVFDANAIPLFAKPIYRWKASSYSEILKNEAQKYSNVIYVNPTQTNKNPKNYGHTLAEDKFHPNDNGYTFWFDLVREAL